MIPKFRAWDITNKKMQDVLSLHMMTGMVGVHEKYLLIPQEALIMQSTGLFDKNGVEIFEGDVVKFVDASYINGIFDDTFINIGVVEFSQGMFTISNREAVEMDDLLDGSTWDVEVIGNIYENPEMVEV